MINESFTLYATPTHGETNSAQLHFKHIIQTKNEKFDCSS